MQCTCITFLHRKKVMQGYGSACVCLFWQHGNKLMADEVSWCARAFQSDRAGVSILTVRSTDPALRGNCCGRCCSSSGGHKTAWS